MANIKSQIKRNRQNELARQRNKAVRSALKTAQKKVRTAVTDGDAAGAESGTDFTRMRSRSRDAMTPRIANGSSRDSRSEESDRTDPARSFPNARSHKSHIRCSPSPRNCERTSSLVIGSPENAFAS